jgi:hypothetical protein
MVNHLSAWDYVVFGGMLLFSGLLNFKKSTIFLKLFKNLIFFSKKVTNCIYKFDNNLNLQH